MDRDEMMNAGGGKSCWFVGSLAVVFACVGLLYFQGFFDSEVDIALRENTPPQIIVGN